MITLSSLEIKNTLTKRGCIISLIMSPEILNDYIEGHIAIEIKNSGMLDKQASKTLLDKYRVKHKDNENYQ